MNEADDPKLIREREHVNSTLKNIRAKREAGERARRFLEAWKVNKYTADDMISSVGMDGEVYHLTVEDLEALLS